MKLYSVFKIIDSISIFAFRTSKEYNKIVLGLLCCPTVKDYFFYDRVEVSR